MMESVWEPLPEEARKRAEEDKSNLWDETIRAFNIAHGLSPTAHTCDTPGYCDACEYTSNPTARAA